MCEQTWIDGKKYFDRNEDRAMINEIQKERSTLVQKVLAAKKGDGGGGGKPPSAGENEEISGKER